jgi:2-pyrone-4,6-dicarboxylate lactonase
VIGAMSMMRKPAFNVPRGACDTHVHIWGPFDRFPVAKARPIRRRNEPATI